MIDGKVSESICANSEIKFYVTSIMPMRDQKTCWASVSHKGKKVSSEVNIYVGVSRLCVMILGKKHIT